MCLPAVHLMDGRTASQPACLPAVSPGCARCRASKITVNPHPIYENVILKTIIPVRHDIPLYFLPMFSSESLPTNMCKQVTSRPRHDDIPCKVITQYTYVPISGFVYAPFVWLSYSIVYKVLNCC